MSVSHMRGPAKFNPNVLFGRTASGRGEGHEIPFREFAAKIRPLLNIPPAPKSSGGSGGGSGSFLPLAGGTMTGAILAADGSASSPSVVWGTNTGFFNDTTNTCLGLSIGGTQHYQFDDVQCIFDYTGGTGTVRVQAEGSTALNLRRSTTDANGPVVSFQKQRGTLASPSVPAKNDALGSFNFQGYNGSGFTTGATVSGFLIEPGTVSSSAMGSEIRFLIAAAGAGTLSNTLIFNPQDGLKWGGTAVANTVIDANRLHILRGFATGSLPASPATGALAYDTTTTTPKVYNGAAWKSIADIQTQLDGISSTRGTILYRGASGWAALAPGTSGLPLISNGAGADPSYNTIAAGGAAAVKVDTYSAAGANTWNKPTGATRVKVILWGAGGGGGGGRGGNSTSCFGGAGGGGGANVIQEFNASDLGSSETVTIAAGGTGGTGGSNADGTAGSAGGNTTFGAHLTGYGGGAGGLGTTGSRAGGGGGGSGQAGNNGGAGASPGGGPGAPQTTGEAVGGAGAASGNSSGTGRAAEFGGGSGAGGASGVSNAGNGGSSMWGGAGGGNGGWVNSSNSTNNTGAGDGGGSHVYTPSGNTTGAGGARGTSGSSPTAGTNGATGTETWGGSGGGGGGSNTSANGTGAKGGDGGQRGGGGGGGGAAGAAATSTNTGGAGGKGGDGYAIVVTYF